MKFKFYLLVYISFSVVGAFLFNLAPLFFENSLTPFLIVGPGALLFFAIPSIIDGVPIFSHLTTLGLFCAAGVCGGVISMGRRISFGFLVFIIFHLLTGYLIWLATY